MGFINSLSVHRKDLIKFKGFFVKDDCIFTSQTLRNIASIIDNNYKVENTKLYQQHRREEGIYPFRLIFSLKKSPKRYSISLLVKMDSVYDISNIFKEIDTEIQPYII